MITPKQEEKILGKIKSLPEIELISIIEELGDHLKKNKLLHLLYDSDRVNDLESEVSYLQDKLDDVESELSSLQFDIRKLCDDALEIEDFEDDSYDRLMEIIREIKSNV